MAEESYSPFNGYGGAARPARGALGSKLSAPDWQSHKLVPSEWKVFSAAKLSGSKRSRDDGDDVEKVPQPSTMSSDDCVTWRKEHEITVLGESCPAPITSFAALKKINAPLSASLVAQGFKDPTAIQAQSWPILLDSRDMVGIAKTGSGKTLSFMIPALIHIQAQAPLRSGDGPICVVLAPTRELAQQIEVETQKVLPASIRCTCIYGGSPKGPQLAAMSKGVHVLVATPGRLIDFLEMRKTNLLRVSFLVLDEADRMLDMGFEPQVRAICSQIRADRQTVMFSATWPREIQSLAAEFQRDFIRIHVGSTELVANADVTQHIVFTTEQDKPAELRKLLFGNRGKRILVFAKMKRTADDLEYQMRGMGLVASAIHGDKEQAQREYVLARFRKEQNMILVATDVAARGLDVKDLDLVINYDFPMQIDDYVHRIGRTGRAGAKGDAYTLITKKEEQITRDVAIRLVQIMEGAKQKVPADLIVFRDEMMRTGGVQGLAKRTSYGQRNGFVPGYKHASRPSFNAGPSNAAPSNGNAGGAKSFFGAPKSSVTKFEDD